MYSVLESIEVVNQPSNYLNDIVNSLLIFDVSHSLLLTILEGFFMNPLKFYSLNQVAVINPKFVPKL
jgi:hypothetical protein